MNKILHFLFLFLQSPKCVNNYYKKFIKMPFVQIENWYKLYIMCTTFLQKIRPIMLRKKNRKIEHIPLWYYILELGNDGNAKR